MFEFTKPGKVLAAPRFESVQSAGGELQYPSCGFNYLHQGRVEVFDRTLASSAVRIELPQKGRLFSLPYPAALLGRAECIAAANDS